MIIQAYFLDHLRMLRSKTKNVLKIWRSQKTKNIFAGVNCFEHQLFQIPLFLISFMQSVKEEFERRIAFYLCLIVEYWMFERKRSMTRNVFALSLFFFNLIVKIKVGSAHILSIHMVFLLLLYSKKF